ncbi:hypothetical protein [Usitatibacter palustris]|uniref:NnrS family protein n=1 Tax=Usitatibacter palustris TaxID=2732487 RepID=A0A6M4H541_9PROT|nr:hypothetical protein [Usitatibacter palustris]QJR14275.1 hypothetical protein DSM104440_01068 [Usitatibacter palustris]
MSAAPRLALLAFALACAVTGIAGGLARAGIAVDAPTGAALHAVLMIPGFLGTVISLERAVALGSRWAFGAPLAAGLGAVLFAFAPPPFGLVLMAIAPLWLTAASVAIAARQFEPHTALLVVASLAWAVGNVAFHFGAASAAPAWWFVFLVLTIAAERLEMTRLMKRRAAAAPLLGLCVALLLAGAALSLADAARGGIAFGMALAGLAAWLAVFDLARRTIRTEGFSRYAAVALLAGYGWLGVAGFAWAMQGFDPRWRDAALHALGLGFVFSMILAHAPLVVPVIARRRLAYTPAFYIPLALLHASLLVRLALAPFDAAFRAWGAALNAVALVVFVATLAVAMSRRGASGGTGSLAPPL